MTRDLDIVAGAIIERLKEHGADIILDGDKAMFWFPEAGVGRRPEQDDAWSRGYTDGSMRELHSLVAMVPGLREAIKAHVRAWPSIADSEGRLTA